MITSLEEIERLLSLPNEEAMERVNVEKGEDSAKPIRTRNYQRLKKVGNQGTDLECL